MQQTEQLKTFTSYQKFVIAMLALLQFTIVLDFMVLSPLGNILIRTMNLTPEQFGQVVAAYGISAGIAGIAAAGFTDKFDRKKLLLFFYCGFIVGTVLCGMANSHAMLLVARIVTGIFGGVIGSISMAIVTDLFSIQQRGRVMGFTQMAFAGSQVLGIPVGLYLANHFGWNSAFFMIVGLAAVIAVLILVKMNPVTEHLSFQSDKSPFLHLWHTISRKSYRIGFLAAVLLPVGGFMMMPFGTTFLEHNIKIPAENQFLVFLFTGLASMIMMPLIGRLSDKLNKFAVFVTGSVIAIIMVTIYTHLSAIPLWLVVVINILMFVGIMGRIVPSTALATAVPDMKDRGAYMSINSSLQYLMGGISSIVAGLIVVQETPESPLQRYDILGFVVSGVTIVCIFLVYRMSIVVKNKMAAAKTPASSAA